MGHRHLRNGKKPKKRRVWAFLIQIMIGILVVIGGSAIALPHPSSPWQDLQQGQVAYEAEDYADAIAHWQIALDRLPPQAGEPQHLLLLTNLALAYQRLGQWESANVMVEEGTSYARILFQTLEPSEQDPDRLHASALTVSNNRSNAQIVGRFFNIQGLLLWHQDNPEAALASWEQAIAAYDQGDYPRGKLGSQLNQARALQALGFVRRAQDKVGAINQALESQPDTSFKALGLRNVGNVFWQMGEVGQAIATLTQSLDVVAQTQRDRSQTMLILGNVERTATEQAIAIRNQQQAEIHRNQALGWYQQAAHIADHINDPTVQAKAQVNELNFLVDLVQWKDSQRIPARWDTPQWDLAFERAEAIASTIDPLPPTPSTLPIQLNYTQSLAKIFLASSSSLSSLNALASPASSSAAPTFSAFSAAPTFSAASATAPTFSAASAAADSLLSLPLITQRFTTIIQHAHRLNDLHLESYSQGELGHLYEMTHHWSLAQSLTEQALALANQIQSADIQYQWEWQMGRIFIGQEGSGPMSRGPTSHRPTTHEPIRRGPEGIEATRTAPESLRHRAIASYRQAVLVLEEVRRDLLVIDTDIQFSFRDDVEPLYRQYVDVLLRSPHPSPQTLATATNLIDSLQLAELENSMRCDVNRFLQISQATIDDHTAVIYPMVLDDRLEVVLSMPNQPLKRHQLEVPRKTVDSVTDHLQQKIARASQRKASQRLMNQLYQWLIEPWEAELKVDEPIESSTIDTLVFVLDGDLKSVPMAALWDNNRERYLLERYAIAVAPSLQLVKPKPLERPLRVLAAGSTNELHHPLSGRRFAPLKNVDDELEGISEYMSTETLLNMDFTRPKLEEKLETESFEILHLATHGQFSSDPNRTFVLLNDTPLYASDLDELLRLNTIQDPVKMIVLSACQTAIGDRRATLGLAGLTLRAGAQSAVATLWSVDDQSAATLMQEFYRQMANHRNISLAEALRRSQLALWQQDDYYQKDWDAPYFWSPFILVGNWL